jgi:hypothetical protein
MTERSLLAVTFAIALALTDESIGQCGAPPNDALGFVRKHKVPNFNGEPPELVEDTLLLWTMKDHGECFSLDTLASNSHECGTEGDLRTTDKNTYRFEAQECSITLQREGSSIKLIVGPMWRRSGTGGTCPARYKCGMYGSVESGTFVPQIRE